MLGKITKLIEENPKKVLSIWLLIVIPLAVISHILKPQVQEQQQTKIEPFDRTKCKVYTIGVALDALVYQFKGVDGKLDYILVANDPGVIQTFDRTDYGIIWWSSSGFRSSDYLELVKVLPPEGLKELDAILDSYSYAALGTSAFAKAIRESPNAGVLNTCDVE